MGQEHIRSLAPTSGCLVVPTKLLPNEPENLDERIRNIPFLNITLSKREKKCEKTPR